MKKYVKLIFKHINVAYNVPTSIIIQKKSIKRHKLSTLNHNLFIIVQKLIPGKRYSAAR